MAKKAKTKADREWQNRVAQLGCLACEIDGHDTPEVVLHHITTRTGLGKRPGHRDVIPLCFIHHDHKEYPQYAIHADIAGWEEKYDSQEILLQKVYQQLN